MLNATVEKLYIFNLIFQKGVVTKTDSSKVGLIREG